MLNLKLLLLIICVFFLSQAQEGISGLDFTASELRKEETTNVDDRDPTPS